jgi:hypothetical protein
MTIHKEAAAIRAACNRKAQEEEQLNVLPGHSSQQPKWRPAAL